MMPRLFTIFAGGLLLGAAAPARAQADAGCSGPCLAELPDTDGDGLADEVEEQLGTDPDSADTDGDGIMDGLELSGNRVTDPNRADSDGDGCCDGPVTVDGQCLGGEDRNGDGSFDALANDTDPTDSSAFDCTPPDEVTGSYGVAGASFFGCDAVPRAPAALGVLALCLTVARRRWRRPEKHATAA